MSLTGRHVLVGVGGGIAAFKSVVLVRELVRRGAEVRVAMTPSATKFVGAATFSGITGRLPYVDLWAEPGEVHVELGAWADAVIVAPATANVLSRAAQGQADDVVLATLLCARGPVLFAPAMHHRMWAHPALQRAVAILGRDGARFAGPVSGALASGESGMGRMAEPEQLADAVEALFVARDLEGVRVLVTAGPTVEDLDPVRFLGNRSTGKMGFALAERAAARGAEVVLIAGPVSLPTPPRVERVDVRSALELQGAVQARIHAVDAVIMCAAVADYRPLERAPEKLKKQGDRLTLELVKNPDILAELGARRGEATSPVLIGFAVETTDVVRYAREKRAAKRCDLIVANAAADSFGRDDNTATLVDGGGEVPLGVMAKRELADRIFDWLRARRAAV